jgi:hypothetical protein
MRNISFALTPDQIEAQIKTNTRRQGWWNLKPGTLLQPVRKGMGLKKGEKVARLGGPIKIISVRREPLNAITPEDVIAEGFPDWSREQFIQFYAEHNRIEYHDFTNRIEFKYVNPPAINTGDAKPRSGAVYGTMPIEKAREIVSAALECGFHDMGLFDDDQKRPAWPVQYTLEELLIANRVVREDSGVINPDGSRSMMMNMADRGVAARYALAHYGGNPEALLESLGYELSSVDE